MVNFSFHNFCEIYSTKLAQNKTSINKFKSRGIKRALQTKPLVSRVSHFEHSAVQLNTLEHSMEQLVEALFYKPEGRGFNSR